MSRLFLVCTYLGIQCWPLFGQAMVLLIHPEVMNSYLNFRRESTDRDPLLSFDHHEREYMCDQFLQANLYYLSGEDEMHLQSDHPKIQRDLRQANYQVIGRKIGVSTGLLAYNEKLVTMNSVPVPIRAFPCAVSRTYIFYVTYGFNLDYLFVLVKLAGEDDTTLRLWAVIISEPIFYSSDTYQRNYLNEYFWNFIIKEQSAKNSQKECLAEFESLNFEQAVYFDGDFDVDELSSMNIEMTVPRDMEFESVSHHQHFHLCAAIDNELGSFSAFPKMNIIASMTKDVRSSRRKIVKYDGSLVVHANALPCAINREWKYPQFYLLRDPRTSASVFVLKPRLIEKHGEVLWLEAKMDYV